MAWRSRMLWKSRSYWGFRSEELTKSHRAKKWSHMKTEKGFWYFVLTTSLRDAPWGTSGKKSAGQCRRHQKCDPWVGKIPWSGNGTPRLSTQIHTWKGSWTRSLEGWALTCEHRHEISSILLKWYQKNLHLEFMWNEKVETKVHIFWDLAFIGT